MKNYLKLVHFEIKRFWKLYAVLAALIALGQLAIVFFSAREYVSNFRTEVIVATPDGSGSGNISSFTLTNIIDSPIFLLTIMLGVSVLVIYMFFIWYRDWFGKNTFAYRLLMMPTNRMNIFYAKGTSIFLLIFGLVAMQALLVIMEQGIIDLIVPQDYIVNLGIVKMVDSSMLGILLPGTMGRFFVNYGLGLVALITVFSAILLERSYRMRGVILAIIYCLASGFISFLPLIVQSYSRNYFYEKELLLMEIGSCLIVLIMGLLLSRYLINRKITV